MRASELHIQEAGCQVDRESSQEITRVRRLQRRDHFEHREHPPGALLAHPGLPAM